MFTLYSNYQWQEISQLEKYKTEREFRYKLWDIFCCDISVTSDLSLKFDSSLIKYIALSEFIWYGKHSSRINVLSTGFVFSCQMAD